ncbi:hypothetical protein PR048_022426 [Dryococelus australis]|uniref:Uncharacterized protein n=1 Tax=Dryococelus australis TaxID=614101 RepID=A0ABQ9H0Z7_9NEOP|nr:hypothetical protein PR048_022426 [Dryococelus australis]
MEYHQPSTVSLKKKVLIASAEEVSGVQEVVLVVLQFQVAQANTADETRSNPKITDVMVTRKQTQLTRPLDDVCPSHLLHTTSLPPTKQGEARRGAGAGETCPHTTSVHTPYFRPVLLALFTRLTVHGHRACQGAAVMKWLDYLLLGEPGLIPGGVPPGLSRVGIMSDDAAGRMIFLGTRPCIPALLHDQLVSPSPALKTSISNLIITGSEHVGTEQVLQVMHSIGRGLNHLSTWRVVFGYQRIRRHLNVSSLVIPDAGRYSGNRYLYGIELLHLSFACCKRLQVSVIEIHLPHGIIIMCTLGDAMGDANSTQFGNRTRFLWLGENSSPQGARWCSKRSLTSNQTAHPTTDGYNTNNRVLVRGRREGNACVSPLPLFINTTNSFPVFCMWESCWTMPLICGFSRGSPPPPSSHSSAAPYFPHFTNIGSQDLDDRLYIMLEVSSHCGEGHCQLTDSLTNSKPMKKHVGTVNMPCVTWVNKRPTYRSGAPVVECIDSSLLFLQLPENMFNRESPNNFVTYELRPRKFRESNKGVSMNTARLSPGRTGFDSRRGVAPIFSHVVIVPGVAAGRRVLSFPPPLHSDAAPHSPRFALIGS